MNTLTKAAVQGAAELPHGLKPVPLLSRYSTGGFSLMGSNREKRQIGSNSANRYDEGLLP